MDQAQFWFQDGPGGNGGDPGDPIGESLRFRGVQSLSGHTGGSGTASVWVKRAKLGAAQTAMPGIAFDAGDTLNSSVALFRDPGAWMHVVVNANGTYVNGVSVSSGTSISAGTIGTSCELYLAQFYFIDGQALEPTAFGRENANGVWVPVNPNFNAGEIYSNDLFSASPASSYGSLGKNFNFPAALAFDGVLTQGAGSNSCGGSELLGWLVYKPATPIIVSGVRVWTRNASNAAVFSVNNGPAEAIPALGSNFGWVDLGFSGTLTSFGVRETAANNYTYIGGIEITDSEGTRVLIDGGDWGTNGFHLTFDPTQDPDPQVAIGMDSSGNNNHFTATGFEATDTSSPDYDVMQDSPTQNYATLNPIDEQTSSNASQLLYDANLKSTNPVWGNNGFVFINRWFTDNDQYYFEINIGQRGNSSNQKTYPTLNWIGIDGSNSHSALANETSNSYFLDGKPDWDAGDTLRIRTVSQTQYDFAKNDGPWLRVVYPMPVPYKFGLANSDNSISYFNFGQQPFLYDVPAGWTALQTANMPAANLPDEITGEFTGNSSADGPFVYTGCIPGRIQYGSVDVTYDQRLGQTDVDFLSNGFKVRSTTSNSGTVNYTVTTTHNGGEYDGFKVPFNSPAPAVSN
jgi:hypothetical protein